MSRLESWRFSNNEWEEGSLQKQRMGMGCVGSSSAEKDRGGLVDSKLSVSQACALAVEEEAITNRWSHYLLQLSNCETICRILYPDLGCPIQRKYKLVSSLEGGSKLDSGLKYRPSGKKLRKWALLTLEKVLGPNSSLYYKEVIEEVEPGSSQCCVVEGWETMGIKVLFRYEKNLGGFQDLTG